MTTDNLDYWDRVQAAADADEEKIEQLEETIKRLEVHFHALCWLLDENDPVTPEEFAKQFPRTYKAAIARDPTIFEV